MSTIAPRVDDFVQRTNSPGRLTKMQLRCCIAKAYEVALRNGALPNRNAVQAGNFDTFDYAQLKREDVYRQFLRIDKTFDFQWVVACMYHIEAPSMYPWNVYASKNFELFRRSKRKRNLTFSQ